MNKKEARISIVVAMGHDQLHNHVIGKDNALLWYIPEDLKRFKELTLGHPVIMGRKTFESIVSTLGKALPGRQNIVITRNPLWTFENVIVTNSLDEALTKAKEFDQEDIFIGGGSEIYELSLPYVDRLYITYIDEKKDGDSFFPHFENIFTTIISDETHEWSGIEYRWVTLER